MDFLDPKAKRRHLIRLIIGYGLMAILIIIATLILFFHARGFDVDRETGEVIQNGLVYIDSAPDDAAVYLNGQEQKERTNNRFALPAGQYDMKLAKEGYRDWQRHFTLEGGSVERFTYPMLIPKDLNRRDIQIFDAAPTFSTESPDRRWVIVNQAGAPLTNFIEYDLNSLTDDVPKSRQFTVPAGLFTSNGASHTLELVEWSNDNKHFLVKHTFDGGNEFVLISRDQPETSININTLLARNPTEVSLRDKKFDSWYLYTQPGGTLVLADPTKTITPVLTGVTAYKSHGDDTILYSQLVNDNKNQRITLLQGKNSYMIKEVPAGAVYLDIARYDGAWYMVIGADADQKTYIYRDPVAVLQRNDGSKPTPRSVLRTTGPITQVSFSKNTRFILAQSGQHFETYDAEYNRIYRFEQKQPVDKGSKVDWMDGHRMLMRSGGVAYMFDYDGANQQQLVSSVPQAPIMFDRDYTVLYSVAASPATAGTFGLFATDLRLEGDK